MKIAQFYQDGQLRLGRIEWPDLVPLDFQGGMLDFILASPECRPAGDPIPLEQVQFAPALDRPSKIIAIGLNYMDHVQESGGMVPEVPVVFAKFPSSLAAHRQHITWEASLTGKVDFEAELAVVMGREVRRASAQGAMETVFGYTCANDVSARDLQFGDGQWVRGKSLDTFCPLGPWIVTADQVPDPHALPLRCWVNGEIMQESHTERMIFKVPELIRFLSECFTLLPGDVILTGTPHGVGAFRDPPVYLRDGDEVVVEIGGVGRLLNKCRVL